MAVASTGPQRGQTQGAYGPALDTVVKALLSLAAQAHHWHLATRSYAQHKAFGDLYSYAHEAADALAEPAMGDGGYTPESLKSPIGLVFCAPEAAPRELEDICDMLHQLESRSPDWLVNLLQELQGRLYSTLYQLKRLS